jgi:dihydroxyacetone kinase-like predicted kinase
MISFRYCSEFQVDDTKDEEIRRQTTSVTLQKSLLPIGGSCLCFIEITAPTHAYYVHVHAKYLP